MKSKLFLFAKNHMGAANLEASSIKGLMKSFIGKLIQPISSTKLPVGSKFRCQLERIRGVKIGENVFLSGGNFLDRTRPDLITLEDYTAVSGGVHILTHSNPPAKLRELLGPASSIVKPVIIKKGAWLAINCIILPGVIIGENSIVSAGSVVSKDVEPYTIVAGNPARIVKRIDH